ncbi:hypothetical protein D3C84_1165700 [compost metagenome]
MAGVNAAHLLNRVLGDDPEAAVLVEIPLALVVVTDDDVVCGSVFLAAPGPAVPRDYAGFVAVVLRFNGGMECLRGVEHLEFVLIAV